MSIRPAARFASAAALASALLPAAAFAHEGPHDQLPLATALRHLLSEPDHLLVLALLVAILALPAVRIAMRRARR